MMNDQQQAITSGAKHVEETEHLAASLEAPPDLSIEEREPEAGLPDGPIKTKLGNLTLSMFQQGQSVRVRVGDPHNASELYEQAFATADEANTALLDAGVFSPEQVPDPTQLAGAGVALQDVTAEQLEEAGLKRHGTSTL